MVLELSLLPIFADYYLPKVAATVSIIGSTIVLSEVLQDHKLAWRRTRTRSSGSSRRSSGGVAGGDGSTTTTSRQQQRHTSRHGGSGGGASTISRILFSMSIGDILFSL